MTGSSKRFVVTGGAGFVGSHLCEVLTARGDSVVCVDNLSTGRAENVMHLQETGRLSLIVSDVSVEIPVDGKVDAVLHLASPASPAAYFSHPLETLAVGSEGTRLALELASASGARFVLASTSEIYGDPAVHPQTEDYWGNVNPIGPRSVYDEAKRFAESLTAAWKRARGLSTGIVRIFNTYGPRLLPGDGRVVSNFIVQAMKGEEITVYGDGSQTRSLCYVDDTVTGIVALLDSVAEGPVNIGNPRETTILELAELVKEVVGSTSEVVYMDLPQDDPTRRCPDVSQARELLGWSPTVELRDGLRLTADHLGKVIGKVASSANSTGEKVART